MKHITNAKIITAILIPMLLIPLSAFGYAHWTDSVSKQYKFHYLCTQTKIKTNKVLTDWVDDKYIIKIPSDDELSEMDGTYTLKISTDRACPNFDVWIGVMLHNQGTLPERVYEPIITITQDPPDSVTLTYVTYTYGIYTRGDFTNFYADINRKNFRTKLDPTQGIVGETPIDLPIVIDPCEKLVMWTYVKLIDGPLKFTVQIEISVHTEFA